MANGIRQFLVNVPLDMGTAVETEAQRTSTSYTAVFRRALAHELGLPEPTTARVRRTTRRPDGTSRRLLVAEEAVEHLDDEWRPAAVVARAWKGSTDRRAVNATRRALREAVARGAAESLGDGRGGQGRPTLFRRAQT